MSERLKVIILDDDPISNFLTKKVIEKSHVATNVVVFQEPTELLTGLAENKVAYPDIIFIDLNMPKVNGWQFIDLFNEIDTNETEKVNLIILSSSSNWEDIEMAGNISRVKDYIIKPLTIDVMESLCQSINENAPRFI